MTQYIGQTIKTFYCEGAISKDFDLEGAVILNISETFIVVRTIQGLVYADNFIGEHSKWFQERVKFWVQSEEE